MNQLNSKKNIAGKPLGTRLLQALFIVMIACIPMFGSSQDPNGVPDPGNGGGNPDAGSVPIDGGLSLLLAAGVGYGAKKLRSHNKKKKEVESVF